MNKVFMIVDDDDRFFLIEAITKINAIHKCIEAANGKIALDYLMKCEELPNYIFLDIYMPIMGDNDVLRGLKKNKKLSAKPVIIYSSSTNTRDIEESMSLGTNAHLAKPATLERLPEEVANVLEMYA